MFIKINSSEVNVKKLISAALSIYTVIVVIKTLVDAVLMICSGIQQIVGTIKDPKSVLSVRMR